MVGCRYDDNMTGKRVNLQKQRAYHPLDLAGLVRISAFLSERIELIEEKYALVSSNEVEKFLKTAAGLTEKAADDSLIPNNEQGREKLCC